MNPTRLKNRWLEKLLDVAITVLSGYGVCAFTLFRGTDKGIAGFIVLFIWAFVATFFWASSLQHFRFVQKLKFYLVLTLSSLLFISHDNHTMEENGLLFFHDLRFVLPHRRPDVTEFVIIAIDTATNTGMEKNANYRKKCIKIFSALDSANISPRLAVLAKEIIEPDDPTRDAAMASQLLARIIGRQAFPVLLRDDYYETNDKEALDFTFCAELNSIYGDDHWNTRWGFLQYNLYGGYSERLIIQNVILRQGARKHLALLAAESLNRLSKSVDTSKVHIIDYPRKKVTVVRVRALLAKKRNLEALNQKIIVLGAVPDTLAYVTCFQKAASLSQAEALAYSTASLMGPAPIREVDRIVIFLIYILAITLNLEIFSLKKSVFGLKMTALYLAEFFLFLVLASLAFAFGSYWSNYHYFFASLIFSYFIYHLGTSKNEQTS